MQKIKNKKTIALSLLLASAVAVGGAAIALGGAQNAYAADYTQQLDGTKVFYTGIRGAEISSSPIEGEGENTHAYTMFKIGKDETVEYRQNLAYSWRTSAAEVGTFSMEIGFNSADFERYVIRFQSQQYLLTEDKITENYIVFTPSTTENKLDMSVVQELEDDTKLEPVATYDLNKHIKIAFGEFSDGEYPLLVNETAVASFKNVYEPFATYISSGDKAVTPLTFSATLKEGAAEDATAQMVLYDINGQSFELKSTKKDANGNTVYETKITDNAEPVMCFTKTPSYLISGDSINFDYKVIDVIGTSTRATAYYYVLTADQYSAEGYDYDKTEYTEEEKDKNPFIEITSSSSIRIIRDEKTFIPSSMINDGVEGLVKLYYKIADRAGSTAKSDIIFADWYAKDDALVDIASVKNGGTTSNFLKLIDENDHKDGLTYAQPSDLEEGDVLASYKSSVQLFQKAYQKKIDEAIAALKDEDGNPVGKLYAGTDSKFYLPSFENLTDENGNPLDFDIAALDDYFFKGDYKYSIYYKAKTSGSSTSLEANALSIGLSEADVNYRFTIFVTDAFGNDMRYPAGRDEETQKVVWENIATGDVWDEDYADLLPFFEFHVSYKEATATPPETLSIAYVNTAYSGVSFNIKGVSGTYTAKYNLYVVDRDALNKQLGSPINYETFKGKVEELFKSADTRKYFTTVKPATTLVETDENYEEFKELNWNATSISFTPRSVEDFYVVRLELTDNNSNNTDYQYTTVSASVETTPLKGEDDWLENNRTSVILLSVAGLCLIALVVFLIVKPKDKGDIDTVYNEEVEKENTKKNKSKNKSKRA